MATVDVKELKRAAARTEQCSYDAAESVVNHDVVALLKESNNSRVQSIRRLAVGQLSVTEARRHIL